MRAAPVLFALVLAACAQGDPSTSGGGFGGSSGESGSPRAIDASAPVIPIPESKVDLLFDIDNSASVGDKQAYLVQAIPELIARLVAPRCLDVRTQAPTGDNADPAAGSCPSGSVPELAPVRDMHIGVVTSSLGPRLGVQGARGVEFRAKRRRRPHGA